MVAGYGTQTEYVQEIVGDHAFVRLEARRYTIERCVVAPKNETISVIDMAAKLVVCAVRREGHQAGNAIVCLPVIQEMLRLRELIKRL